MRGSPAEWVGLSKTREGDFVPLKDHFCPPLHPRRHWESFYATWAGTIADSLNGALLPVGYYAEEYAHVGDRSETEDRFGIRVYEAEGGARLVAALELVSPANKDNES